eukprot:gene8235-9117_t
MAPKATLTSVDFIVIAAYFLGVIGVGVWSLFRANRSTVSGYFLAGRFMTFVPVGMSLFASNIGSEHLVGLAGSGAAAGIGVGAFEFNALILLQLLGFVFLPVYIASGVCTLPEYIHKRFGGHRIRVFLALLSLILYIFTKISVNMYSGALFIQQSVGWNLYVSILFLLGITALCTITGGLAAVIYLDTLMAVVMVSGAFVMTIMGFEKVGGYSGLRTSYMNAMAKEVINGNVTCGGVPRPDSFVMLRDPGHSDMPWPGFLLGQTPASIWYWCADQVIVQRALAAKSLSHAQAGSLLAGYIKILPLFIMVLPGMISRVLYADEVACTDPERCFEVCGSRAGCTNIAYPRLVLGIMPSGLRGMMMAVMMAALMSDLTSIFNSASTLFTMDIWKRIRKNAGTRELMIVGRLFIVVMCVIGICWVPIVSEFQGGQLFIYIQAVSAYLAPPVASVYLIAIFWKRSNEQGTFWGLMVGFVCGIIRMVLDFVYQAPACSQKDNRPIILKNFHYMYFALMIFFLTAIVCIVVSLCTKAPDPEMIIRTTFWTRHDQTIRSDEVKEDLEMRQIDAEDQMKRTHETHPSHQTQDSAFWVKDQDVVNLKESVEFEKPVPRWKKVLHFICGFADDVEEEKKSSEEQREHLKEVISLNQNSKAKFVLRANLVLILSVAVFLYIFFSIPDGGPTKPTIAYGINLLNKTSNFTY